MIKKLTNLIKNDKKLYNIIFTMLEFQISI